MQLASLTQQIGSQVVIKGNKQPKPLPVPENIKELSEEDNQLVEWAKADPVFSAVLAE